MTEQGSLSNSYFKTTYLFKVLISGSKNQKILLKTKMKII